MKKLQHLSDCTEDFKTADREYKYQPELTKKLDSHAAEFSEKTILEIALWKTNRYPKITQEAIDAINELRTNYSDDYARLILRKLLELKGFDLPMASTVLRFAVPQKLQIIDQRVYRFITPDKSCLTIPHNIDKKIDLYFQYIEDLRQICKDHNIPFNKADRILYQLDKIYNKHIPLKTSA